MMTRRFRFLAAMLAITLASASLTLTGCNPGPPEEAISTEEQEKNYEDEYDKQMSEGNYEGPE